MKRNFATFLEVLSLIVEAGLDLLSAITLAAGGVRDEKIQRGAFLFKEEIEKGKSKFEALVVWNQTIPRPEVLDFTQMLEHAWKTGGSVGRLLKIEARKLREEIREEQERQMLRIPYLSLIPLLLFIFPAALLVIVSPLLLFFEVFLHQ